MAGTSGEVAYRLYRVLTYGLSPLVHLHLRWRKFRRREHPVRWRERLGYPSTHRPSGRLIWFHAVSLGEGMAVIPLIKCCLERSPDVNVLLTTTTTSAFEVIKCRLPNNVIYQFAPLDIPSSIDNFLQHWRPDAIMLMESELWPNLIIGAARDSIALALLNARVSAKSFRNWSHPVTLPLITLMLSKFSLILPLSTIQGIQLQLLQAPPSIINYGGDLKCAIADFGISNETAGSLEDIQSQLSHRKVWMASSIHKGEEQVLVGAHNILKQKYTDIVTIIVPRQPHHGRDLALKLQKQGVSVALRSRGDHLTPGISIFVVDSLGELRDFYRLTPIAVIGGSFSAGSAGHNISEAAAVGCAVLTGYHVGHFSNMVSEMQRVNPLSVLQVSGEKLAEAVDVLFASAEILDQRRAASRQAYHALSRGVVENVWEMLQYRIFKRSSSREDDGVIANSEKLDKGKKATYSARE